MVFDMKHLFLSLFAIFVLLWLCLTWHMGSCFLTTDQIHALCSGGAES